MRPCYKCKVEKPYTAEFFKVSKKNSTGLAYYCKDCSNKTQSGWRSENHVHQLEWKRNWADKNRDKVNANHRRYRRENPHKHNEIRLRRLKRVPAWSETVQIKLFYLNRPDGYDVDHIYPLQGELVSGLHVIGNLQYLTRLENRRKGNKF